MLNFFIILKHELLLAEKNLAKILQNILFFLISISVFLLISQNLQNQGQNHILVINVILFCLIFSLIFSNSDFLREDAKDGTLDQMLISQANIEVFIAAKMLSNWMVFSLPILVLVPLILVGAGFERSFIINFSAVIFLASLTINCICSFCGSLSIVGNKTPMIAVLALPLIIPILLIACTGMEAEESFNAAEKSAKILAGIFVFIASLLTLTTAKIVRIASE